MAKKATLNFSSVNPLFIEDCNYSMAAIRGLALAETDLSKAKKAFRDSHVLPNKESDPVGYADYKKALKLATAPETAALATARERSRYACMSAVIRWTRPGEGLYTFDIPSFLVTIGALTDTEGELKDKAAKRLETFRALVVDRVEYYVTRRKKGESKLTCKESRAFENTPEELVLALIEGLLATGCFQRSIETGELVPVTFDK